MTIKTYVEVRGLNIYINGSSLEFYKDGKQVAVTNYFEQEKAQVKSENGLGLKFNNSWGELKGFNGIGISFENYSELLKIKEYTETTINNYFENLDNVKMYCLSYTHYYINEETKGYEEMKQLNKTHFEEVEQNWIEKNKQYLIKTGEKVEPYESTVYYYEFKKIEIEKVEEKIEQFKKTDTYKKQKEGEAKYNKLHKMAETMTDAEFEDATGMPKEFAL